jgi:hypothetical protein
MRFASRIERMARGGKPAATEVAVTPTSGGSMLVLSKIW